MNGNKQKQWIVLGLVAVAAVIAVSVAIVVRQPSAEVHNFEQCKAAGGVILETYPEQCMMGKKTFTNESQRINDNDYIGMAEDDALAKARKENVPARVVERDGEGLPITMDFVVGRHNLYIKGGEVIKVDIEGQASDSPKVIE